jgi:hypothetical protein
LFTEAVLSNKEREGKRAKQRYAVEMDFPFIIHRYKFEYLQFLIFLRKVSKGLLTIVGKPVTIKRDGVVLL